MNLIKDTLSFIISELFYFYHIGNRLINAISFKAYTNLPFPLFPSKKRERDKGREVNALKMGKGNT